MLIDLTKDVINQVKFSGNTSSWPAGVYQSLTNFGELIVKVTSTDEAFFISSQNLHQIKSAINQYQRVSGKAVIKTIEFED